MTIRELTTKITTEVLNPILILLFALATVVFIWGIINYVLGSQGEPAKVEKGKKVMLWGLVGMFIMASAWGIVKILCDFFGSCTEVIGK